MSVVVRLAGLFQHLDALVIQRARVHLVGIDMINSNKMIDNAEVFHSMLSSYLHKMRVAGVKIKSSSAESAIRYNHVCSSFCLTTFHDKKGCIVYFTAKY